MRGTWGPEITQSPWGQAGKGHNAAMNPVFASVTRLLRRLLGLLAVALMGAFVLSLLVLGLGLALLSVLWSLLRGKKPAMVAVFQGVQQMSAPFRRSPGTTPRASDADVVDVQAHEVRQALPERHDT